MNSLKHNDRNRMKKKTIKSNVDIQLFNYWGFEVCVDQSQWHIE